MAEELLPEKMEEQQLMDAGNHVLPWDMIVEILSWLPPKSLCRFRRSIMFTMPDGNSIYSLNLDNLLLSYDENYSDIGDLVAPERLDTFDFSVYSLKTDSWRVVKSPIQYNDADTTHGVPVEWKCSLVMTKVGKESSPVIVSFHLAEEEFREIPLPLKVREFPEFENAGIYMESLVSPNYYGSLDPEHET
ncbi:F-box/kelch-repeat protein [Pyrus ussuriensis x Pyrus communis]|uniref:F-box/kelch-repeat protein n=1 Tax=Pyrus ussuriensis x Pyrus communis TaxID=2448454 RepID=A0A5N5FSH7_9ROSA|nr:F-box/kelch-repeat protein [Pyrus ussuriensis x Pyrus communis]